MDKPEPDAVMAAPTELAYINSITRLTAERDELQAEIERLKGENLGLNEVLIVTSESNTALRTKVEALTDCLTIGTKPGFEGKLLINVEGVIQALKVC